MRYRAGAYDPVPQVYAEESSLKGRLQNGVCISSSASPNGFTCGNGNDDAMTPFPDGPAFAKFNPDFWRFAQQHPRYRDIDKTTVSASRNASRLTMCGTPRISARANSLPRCATRYPETLLVQFRYS